MENGLEEMMKKIIDCLKEKMTEGFVAAGYDEKYLRDQGVLYRTMSRRLWKLLCLQDAVRHHREYGRKPLEVYRLMIQQ